MKGNRNKPFVIDSAISSRMPEYSGLQDAFLSGFFASKKKQKLLVRQGLVSYS
jgi:hypothetical protein